MKNFIGVKILQAKPMSRGDYNTYRGWNIPEDENPEDPGYLVKYSDDYESWSPRDTFESAYFEMGDDPTTITPGMVDRFVGDKILVNRLDAKTTIVSVESVTGFKQHEVSSCVDPINYDENIGKDICMNRVKNNMWTYLGFVLQWGRFGLERKNR